MKHIRSFFKIERGEELAVFLLFLYLTLVLTSFTIARAVRDSAFLHQYGAMDLPYVYIGIAVIISFVVSFYIRLASRLNQGTLINATLCDIFTDMEEDIEVRRQMPLVLANIPTQRIVNVLVEALSNEDGLLRFRSIRALNKLRIGNHKLHFDAKAISSRIEAESEKALWYEHARNILYPQKESPDLLAQLLIEKNYQAMERVFRLLGLILPASAAYAAYNAIKEEARSKKANAVEYLDNVLPSHLKKWVLPLIELKRLTFEDRAPEIIEAFSHSTDWVLRECTLDALKKNRWL
jgi:hypothetical protein